MLRSILIAAAAVALALTGALTAIAANTHGKAVSHLAATTTATAEARGDAVSALASSKAQNPTKTTTTSRATESDEDSDNDENENDTHGDAVSVVAGNHDATAAHDNGSKAVNHGGAVSAVARTH